MQETDLITMTKRSIGLILKEIEDGFDHKLLLVSFCGCSQYLAEDQIAPHNFSQRGRESSLFHLFMSFSQNQLHDNHLIFVSVPEEVVLCPQL